MTKVESSSSCCSCFNRLRQRCPRPHGLMAHIITKGCMLGLLFAVVWSITQKQCLPGQNLFGIIILFITAVAGGKLVGAIQLPSFPPFPPLIGMLLAGLALRNIPYVKDAIYIDTKWSGVLRQIGSTLLLIRVSLGLNPEGFRRLKAVCLRVAVTPCIIEASTVAVVAHFLLGLPWIWCFMLGFVVTAQSPAVVGPSMAPLKGRGYGVEKNIHGLLAEAGSIDVILPILAFHTCLAWVSASTGVTWIIAFLKLLAGLAVGLLTGLFLCFFPSKDQEDVALRRAAILLGMCVFIGFGSTVAGFTGAGSYFTVGLCVLAAFGWGTEKVPVLDFMARTWDIFQPLLFGLNGADVTIVTLNPGTVGLGLACIGIGLVVRLLVTYLVVHYAGFNLKEKLFISMAWLPKATVQAALGYKALDLVRGKEDPVLIGYGLQVLTLAILVILITSPIGLIGMGLSGPCLLHRHTQDKPEGGTASQESNGIGQETGSVVTETKL